MVKTLAAKREAKAKRNAKKKALAMRNTVRRVLTRVALEAARGVHPYTKMKRELTELPSGSPEWWKAFEKAKEWCDRG